MELKFLGSLLCAIVLLCGCTDTVEDVNSSLKVQKAQVPLTRAVPDSSTLDDNPKEFTVSEETKRMKELYTQLHSQHRQAPAVPPITRTMILSGAICSLFVNYLQQ